MTWALAAFLLAASVVSAAGGAVIAVALWGDRLGRGFTRRRCTKCWFDLSATPGMTCPECGKTAKAEARLFRTRRRWWWAVLGVVLVVGGAGMAHWRMILRDGFAMLPLALQVELWPYTADPGAAYADIVAKADTDYLKRRAMDTGMRVLVEGKVIGASGAGSGASGGSGSMRARMQTTSQLSWPLYSQWPLGPSGKEDLLKLLKQQELGYQVEAVRAVGMRTDLDERFHTALCTVALEGLAREDALNVLGQYVGEHAWARETLVKSILQSTNPGELYTAANSLVQVPGGYGELLESTFRKTGAEGRQALMGAVGMRRKHDGSESALYGLILGELESSDTRASKTAIGSLLVADERLDAMIIERLGAAEGEGLSRLIELVGKRKSRTIKLAQALEAVAKDEARPAEQRQAAGALAVLMWKKMGGDGGGGTAR